jgi:phosphoribosylaminoimidazolecarboxamide formyltransferase/IMP cyclohydrolase
MKKSFALISVYQKDGLTELAKILKKKGISIIATGGTAKYLSERNIPSIPIEKITGTPESFDGLIKTISFQIEAGILFERGNKAHEKEAEKLGIPAIDYVVCNFYPFWEQPGIEMIDIGGPTLVRAAAKNFAHAIVLVDPKDYGKILGELSVEERKVLATKAFAYAADYDIKIANYFQGETKSETRHFISMDKGITLRYGENPHQKGYFYQDPQNHDPLGLGKFAILQGK